MNNWVRFHCATVMHLPDGRWEGDLRLRTEHGEVKTEPQYFVDQRSAYAWVGQMYEGYRWLASMGGIQGGWANR